MRGMRAPDLTVVRVVQGLVRAQVTKTFLESHGILVALDYESAGPAIGITIDGLGEVRILVPSRRARRARRLLLFRRRPVPYRRSYRRAVKGCSRRRRGQYLGGRRRATGGRLR
ncbi:MAG: hypothetical protein PVH62_01705 [Anaerolineae bacterium]|jgi:hypothetical protein